MTKSRSQQSIQKALRLPRDANTGGVEGAEVCELLLAELQARRARLEKLLHLVCLEAARLPVRRAPLRPRPRCENVRLRHTA